MGASFFGWRIGAPVCLVEMLMLERIWVDFRGKFFEWILQGWGSRKLLIAQKISIKGIDFLDEVC